MVCVLAKGHAGDHANSTNRKGSQCATWSEVGGVRSVKAYNKGKIMGEWTEDALGDAAEVCSSRFQHADGKASGVTCELELGHADDHQRTDDRHVTTWQDDRPGGVHTPIAKERAKGQPCACGGLGSLEHEVGAPGCEVSNHDLCVCSGTMYAEHLTDVEGCDNPTENPAHRPAWRTSPDGAVVGVDATAPEDGDPYAEAQAADIADGDNDDPHEDEIRSDEEREFSRKLREDREAHAAAIEDVTDRDLKPVPVYSTIRCAGRDWPVHPAALIFPTPEPQFREVVESIRSEGQKLAIQLLDAPGRPVIDGCSRLRACAELGITPRTEVVSVIDPIRHVISVNLARRHLTESQRAMAAADLATMQSGDNQHTRSVRSDGAPPAISQAQAAALTGASETLTRKAARVKNQAIPEVAQAVRDRKIKVDAAVELVKLEPAKQREMLERATSGSGEMRAGKVRALVRQEAKREIVAKINTGRVAPIPAGQFGVIYGDYPWLFDNSDQHAGSRGHMAYPGMTIEEILEHGRETAKRAAPSGCVVALWFVDAYLHELGRVLGAYGATMWRSIVWDKRTKNGAPKIGMGTGTRGRHELLILARIGEPVHTLNDDPRGTIIEAAVREHSRKPDEFADLLAKHCAGPFLELFAREPREGWVTWGAEADGAKALDVAPAKKSKILTASDKRAGVSL